MYQTKLRMLLFQLQIIACLMHFTEENCLMLKRDGKARCRALHAFLGLFWVYVRLYLRNERSLLSESYLCFELHTVSHIWV